ncbi:hypothetical protein [Polyangium spumosum]|uniref:PDZ domain-containing protein n=1 Tax=Polyangium spumosum TaxID=889282 RepID=A0A6N7PU77_9BACT|nr:hypothetical protein [Polyangium spumosum]MRG95543.1 hypothetical protein [Polyangium spumosum]
MRLPCLSLLALASCLVACASEPLIAETPCPPAPKSVAPAAALPKAETNAPPVVEVRLAPTRDGASGAVAIDVSMRFSAPPVEFGETRPLVFRLDGARAEDVDELAARDAEGSLALVRDEGDDKDTTALPGWRAERRARGPVTVTYTRKIASTAGARPSALSATAGGFLGLGRAFLLVPETTEPHVMRVRWDVAGLGPGARAASSFGLGDVECIGPLTMIGDATFTAGIFDRMTVEKLLLQEGRGAVVTLTSLGRGAFDMFDVGAWASRAFLSVQPLTEAPLGHFELFLRSSGAAGGRFDLDIAGTGVIAVADEGRTFGWPEKRDLAWAMARLNLGLTVEAERWFDEGFVTYLAVDALRRAELVAPADLAGELDVRATRYFSSRRAHPDDLGMLFAAELDARLRAKSDGKRSLADVIRVITPKPGPHETGEQARVTVAALREAIGKELGAEGETRFAAVLVKGGAAPDVPGDAFGPCLTRVKKKVPQHDLGFDPASVAEKKVRGLSPKSAAAKAGLVEGDRITAADLGDGTIEKPVEVEVDRGGKLTKVRYLPRGENVDAFSFALAPKAPASCGAPRAR